MAGQWLFLSAWPVRGLKLFPRGEEREREREREKDTES